MKIIGLLLLLVGVTGSVVAAAGAAVPEIDSASTIGALALLSGALLVIAGRRRK